MTALILASGAGWAIGWWIGIAVVFVVVALVVPILYLAHQIGGQATDINDSLMTTVDQTASLGELNATNEAAEAIVAGLARGRSRLGG